MGLYYYREFSGLLSDLEIRANYPIKQFLWTVPDWVFLSIFLSIKECCYSGIEYSGHKISTLQGTVWSRLDITCDHFLYCLCYLHFGKWDCGEPVGWSCTAIALFWILRNRSHKIFSSPLGTNVLVIGGSLARNFPSTRRYSRPHASHLYVRYLLLFWLQFSNCSIVTCPQYSLYNITSSLTSQCILLRSRWYWRQADWQAFLEPSISSDHQLTAHFLVGIVRGKRVWHISVRACPSSLDWRSLSFSSMGGVSLQEGTWESATVMSLSNSLTANLGVGIASFFVLFWEDRSIVDQLRPGF